MFGFRGYANSVYESMVAECAVACSNISDMFTIMTNHYNPRTKSLDGHSCSNVDAHVGCGCYCETSTKRNSPGNFFCLKESDHDGIELYQFTEDRRKGNISSQMY